MCGFAHDETILNRAEINMDNAVIKNIVNRTKTKKAGPLGPACHVWMFAFSAQKAQERLIDLVADGDRLHGELLAGLQGDQRGAFL